MESEQRTNSNAIISLVLGVMSFIPIFGFILGIIGIVLSLKSKKEMKQTKDPGNGFATWGLILSILGILLTIFAAVAFFLFIQFVVTDITTTTY